MRRTSLRVWRLLRRSLWLIEAHGAAQSVYEAVKAGKGAAELERELEHLIHALQRIGRSLEEEARALETRVRLDAGRAPLALLQAGNWDRYVELQASRRCRCPMCFARRGLPS